jgi:ABC-type transport system involved in multi-copper enzyme maturation permease subunit
MTKAVERKERQQSLGGVQLAFTQILVLFLDSVRRLRAAKLFWVALGLSFLAAALFGIFELNEEGLKFPFFDTLPRDTLNTRVIDPGIVYQFLFLVFGVALWLSWAAIILALISTADLIPTLVNDGSADLYLVRSIGRVRLFLTRYLTGLLFVAAQAALFTTAAYVVIGLRGGIWMPGLFWTIPYVVFFFSSLFVISATVGLLTGNSVAAILVTILVWFGLFVLNSGDVITLREEQAVAETVATFDARAERLAAELERRSDTGVSEVILNSLRLNLDKTRETADSLRRQQAIWSTVHTTVVSIRAPFPKTNEIVQRLEAAMASANELQAVPETLEELREDRERAARDEDADEEVLREDARERGYSKAGQMYDGRSAGWVFGTSLGFQIVMLAFANWWFVRRDV